MVGRFVLPLGNFRVASEQVLKVVYGPIRVMGDCFNHPVAEFGVEVDLCVAQCVELFDEVVALVSQLGSLGMCVDVVQSVLDLLAPMQIV
jgi:hypothetical protein